MYTKKTRYIKYRIIGIVLFVIGWSCQYIHDIDTLPLKNESASIIFISNISNQQTIQSDIIHYNNIQYQTYKGMYSPIIDTSLDYLFYPNTTGYPNISDSIYCQGVQILGLAKSGTTVSEYLIYLIIDHVCKSHLFVINEPSISSILCNGSHLSSYRKEFGPNERPYYYPDYALFVGYKHHLTSKPPKYESVHWCHLIVFRPPRDRLYSSLHFQRQAHSIKEQNTYAVRFYKDEIDKYAEWYYKYRDKVRDNGKRYMMISYQDMVLRNVWLIKKIVRWLKYDKYFNNSDYAAFADKINWKKLEDIRKNYPERNVNTYRSRHSPNALYRMCHWWEYWNNDTIKLVNDYVKSVFDGDMIRKFNQTCPI